MFNVGVFDFFGVILNVMKLQKTSWPFVLRSVHQRAGKSSYFFLTGLPLRFDITVWGCYEKRPLVTKMKCSNEIQEKNTISTFLFRTNSGLILKMLRFIKKGDFLKKEQEIKMIKEIKMIHLLKLPINTCKWNKHRTDTFLLLLQTLAVVYYFKENCGLRK